jgi:flagellar assembly protein FliH
LSSNKIIRRRSAQTLQGWQLGDLFAPVAPLPVPEAPPAAKKPAPKPVAPPPPVVVAPPPPPIPPEELFRDELAALREEARAEGFEAGRAEGFAVGEADAAAIGALLAHLRDVVEDLEQGIANDVLSLALELTKQIVRVSLRVRPDLVLAIIREAAKSFQGLGENPRLILHPADAQSVRAAIAAEPPGEWTWTIVEDAHVERGGCKFQTSATEIDATLETRWRRVVASLGRDDAWLDLNL